MAKPRAKAQAVKRSQQEIDRLILFERLRGPVFPSVLGSVAVLLWVLTNAAVIDTAPAVLWVGVIGIATSVFFALRRFLDLNTTVSHGGLAVLFGLGLAMATFYTFERTVYLAPPIASSDLRPKGPPLEVATQGSPGPYLVVVEGHLPENQGRASQSVHYVMNVDHGSGAPEVLQGDFTEKWSMRRLGRRGSAPVHTVRDVDQYHVADPANAGFKVSLDELSPASAGEVTVHVHPDPFPTVVLIAIGVGLTAAAMVIDTWQGAEATEGLTTALTLCTLLSAAAFRRFAPAHPGLGDLLFNVALGSLAGYALSSLLFRIGHDPLKRWAEA